MNWDSLDWPAIDRLRETFLTGSAGDYWRHRSDLDNYDFTYAQRIAWKWNAVLAELRRQNWIPPSDSALDWGCGSGIAGRLVRDFFSLKTLRVFDRSELATDYAAEAGHAERWHNEPPGVLVLSHVLNEAREIPAIIERADAVLWVEPGTHADSRALNAIREQLREEFHVVAPCTHQAACGMLAPENARHWCHFFADPPKGIMADSNWVRFAQRAGIDLRSLPYSYLVLCRASGPLVTARTTAAGPAALQEQTRVIGEPRRYKGYAKVLGCDATGVREVMVQKRDGPLKAIRSGSRLSSRPVSGT
jgi:hypothetical protein